MRHTIKKYFIPHEHNNYHPHFLHTKRVVLYGGVGIAIKAFVVIFIFAFPLSAFMAPNVLALHAKNIIALTNDLRSQAGMPAYRREPKLVASSEGKANDMAARQYFNHAGPDGKTITTWIRGVGYDYQSAGENLAVGFYTASDVIAAWKKSATHYANLIDPEFQDIGVGIASGEYSGAPTIYVVQHFGLARGAQDTPFASTKKRSVQKANRTEAPQGQNAQVKGEIVGDAVAPSLFESGALTLMQKYQFAQSVAPALSRIFPLSRVLYLGFIVLFSIALMLNILIEIRKQHPRVIAQTLALIGLFAVLLKI